MKAKIVYIQRTFSAYRLPVFNLLSQYYYLYVLSANKRLAVKEAKSKISIKVPTLKYGKSETNVILNVFPSLHRIKPEVVIHEFSIGMLSLPLVLLYCKFFKIRCLLHGHCYDRKFGFNPDTNFKDKLRLVYMNLSSGIILYSQNDVEKFSNYLGTKKIFVAKNNLDTISINYFFQKFKSLGISVLKEELGIRNNHVISFLGRLIEEKDPASLIDVIAYLVYQLGLDVSCYFIGTGPLETFLRNKSFDLGLQNHIIFLGESFDEEFVGKYLFVSDLMIMPGYMGLSVNHALGYGCPVVTIQKGPEGPYHSPEVENIIDGGTGYKVPDINSLKSVVGALLTNKEELFSLKKFISEFSSKNLRVEDMINGIRNAIDFKKVNDVIET